MDCKCGHDKIHHQGLPSDGVERMYTHRNCRKCGCKGYEATDTTPYIKAREFVEKLFTNGDGSKATRLILWDDQRCKGWSDNEGWKRGDLGGWGRMAVEDKVVHFARESVREFWRRYCADENVIAIEVFEQMFDEPMFPPAEEGE